MYQWQIARLQDFYGSEKILEASKSLNKAVSLAFSRITPRQREAVKHYLGFGRGPDVKNLNTPGHELPWVWTKKFSYVAEKLDCTEQNARKLVERGLSDMRRDYAAALLKRFCRPMGYAAKIGCYFSYSVLSQKHSRFTFVLAR